MSMVNGSHAGEEAGFPAPGCAGSPEIEFKLALIAAAARLRETAATLSSPYQAQLIRTAELLEAMAGEQQA
jgi:hypothetical protein